jgi:hypothetical protein
VIANGQLIRLLPDDNPYKQARMPALALLERLQVCAALNKALGTSHGPYDWDDYPLELIEVAIAWIAAQQDNHDH